MIEHPEQHGWVPEAGVAQGPRRRSRLRAQVTATPGSRSRAAANVGRSPPRSSSIQSTARNWERGWGLASI